MTYTGFILAAIVIAIPGVFSNTSNCSSVVKIESQGVLNYLGRVSFPAPSDFQGQWKAEMNTDLPFTFLGGWGVWVSSKEEEGRAWFRSKDEDLTIVQGDPINFRFRISWFKGDQRPEVLSFKWNNEIICEPTTGSVESIQASRRRRTPTQSRNSRRRYNRFALTSNGVQ